MKIISPFKDFYDYLQGVYGIDEKVVYERKCYTAINDKGDLAQVGIYKPEYLKTGCVYETALLAICGKLYSVFIVNRNFYFGLNNNDLKDGKYEHIKQSLRILDKEKVSFLLNDIYSQTDSDGGVNKYHLRETKLNEKHDCPVLLVKDIHEWRVDYKVMAKNIKLTDFGINQIVSPHDMYISISNFLSREKPVIDTRTDIQKIVGKGFDKKTSFRNVK